MTIFSQAALQPDTLKLIKGIINNTFVKYGEPPVGSVQIIHFSFELLVIMILQCNLWQSFQQQDHCRGMYLPPSITGEEIPFERYS